MSHRRDPDGVRVRRMHDDAGDALRFAQTDVRERLAAIGRLVDAVAERRALPVVRLARPDVDDVRIRLRDRDVADRVRRVGVEDRRELDAVVRGLPDPRGGEADVDTWTGSSRRRRCRRRGRPGRWDRSRASGSRGAGDRIATLMVRRVALRARGLRLLLLCRQQGRKSQGEISEALHRAPGVRTWAISSPLVRTGARGRCPWCKAPRRESGSELKVASWLVESRPVQRLADFATNSLMTFDLNPARRGSANLNDPARSAMLGSSCAARRARDDAGDHAKDQRRTQTGEQGPRGQRELPSADAGGQHRAEEPGHDTGGRAAECQYRGLQQELQNDVVAPRAERASQTRSRAAGRERREA